VRQPRLDLGAAGAPATALVDDRDQPPAPLHDLLGLDAEAVEALDPATEEALEAVTTAMGARVGAVPGLMPLDVRIEQLENGGTSPRLSAS
jgi:hypothetical protein